MTEHDAAPAPDPDAAPEAGTGPATTPGGDAPAPLARTTLAEDLLLVLFDPASGTIAGEGTLFYSLAGAVLADLADQDLVTVDPKPGLTGRRVAAVGDLGPEDPLLRGAWELVAARPRGTQTFLAEVGPRLREPVLDRLVGRGHLVRESGRVLGLIPRTTLRLGETSRRAELVDELRAVLVDGAEPDARAAALGALVFASGSLPVLHREIPWSGAVHRRGTALAAGDWGAAAADAAVQRTAMAIASAGAAIAVSSVASTAAGS